MKTLMCVNWLSLVEYRLPIFIVLTFPALIENLLFKNAAHSNIGFINAHIALLHNYCHNVGESNTEDSEQWLDWTQTCLRERLQTTFVPVFPFEHSHITVRRPQFARSYPTTMVLTDGSTIRIRYHEPVQIIEVHS